MTIADLTQDSDTKVLEIIDQQKKELRKVEAMGLREGSEVRIKRIQGRNIIIQLVELGIDIAIDKELARFIKVN